MKKLFIIIFIFPVTLFSQDVQITSDNQKFLGVQSLYNFNKSYSFYPDKYEATGSVEYFKGGEIEKYFDENGTLRHEVFISDSEEQQNYLKIWNEWGKLKLETLFNKKGLKDGIETFWREGYNNYKPNPPLYKNIEITYSNGKFISSRYWNSIGELSSEKMLLKERTESIFLEYLETKRCYYHDYKHIEIRKEKNDPEYVRFGKTLEHNYEILKQEFVGGDGIEHGAYPMESSYEKYGKDNNYPDDGIVEYIWGNNTFFRVMLLDSSQGNYIKRKNIKTTVDLRFYLVKNYWNNSESTSALIFTNGAYRAYNGETGKVGKDRIWWSNGNLKKEANYTSIENTKTSFKEGLKKDIKFYLKNDFNGLTREWYEGGELLSENYYENGNLKRNPKVFYELGNIKEENIIFNSDTEKKHKRIFKKYYENGNLQETISYSSGKGKGDNNKDGESSNYNEDGILILSNYYKDGNIIARNRFDSKGKIVLKTEKGIIYYLDKKVYEKNNDVIKTYYKNGQLATLIEQNDTLSKESRWFVSGKKEYESVSNLLKKTQNEKIWKTNKLVYNINWSNGSVVVDEQNKIETTNFLNYSRQKSGVIVTPSFTLDVDILNSPYGEKIGEFNDYLHEFSEFQYGYEEYGIAYSDHINGRLKIGPSLWINDDVSFSSSLESTSYGNAWPPGLVLRSKPDKYSKKIIAFQGESYHVSVLGEFINGYSKVRVDFYELGPCEGGSVKKSWEGWAKVIDDFGNTNIDYPPRGC